MTLTRIFGRLLKPATASAGGDGLQAIRVRVRGAYEPDTIAARAGRPLQITFRREETALASERVVFPAFGKSVALPPYEDVTLDLHPDEAGEYEFTGETGMLRGRLIVTP
jgi:plastocyanin domain-containing protein